MTGRRVPPAIGARPSKHGGRRGRTGGPNTKNKCAIIRPAPGVDTVVTGRRPPVLAPTGAAKGQARRNPPVAMPSTCQPGGRSTNSPSGPGWNLAQRRTEGHHQTGTGPGPGGGPDPGGRNNTGANENRVHMEGGDESAPPLPGDIETPGTLALARDSRNVCEIRQNFHEKLRNFHEILRSFYLFRLEETGRI